MFSKGLKFLTSFFKDDRGALSIEHCLVGGAVAVLIVVSVVSVSPDISRIYGDGANVTGSRTVETKKASGTDKPAPGIFAHISSH